MVAKSFARKFADLQAHIIGRQDHSDALQDELAAMFRARPGGEVPRKLTHAKTPLGAGSEITFEAGSGLDARISWPLKHNPSLSPPDYQRQLRIDLVDPGSSGWLALVIPVNMRGLMHATSLFWEIALHGDAAQSVALELRCHGAGGKFTSQSLGYVELASQRSVATRTLPTARMALEDAPGGAAIHVFLPLKPASSLTFDYILAHHD